MTKKRAAGASPARGGARSPRSPRSSPSPAAAAAPATPEASGRPVRIYADGVYDLFHVGHMRQLKQCKELFPNVYLLVGVCSDELTHKYKGKTVMSDTERYEAVASCRWVDEVIPACPWVINAAFLEKHQIDFVAHDDLPYPDATGSADDAYGWVKSVGKFAATQRTEGISTSDLILRLIRDYNDYVLRNLSRGYTRQELGVSFVREKQLRLEGKLQTAKARMKERARRFWADHAELSGAADALAKRFIGMFKGHPGPRARARLAALLADVRRERA